MNTLWADLLVPLLTGICGALLGAVLLKKQVIPCPSPALPDGSGRLRRFWDAVWGTGAVEKPLLLRRGERRRNFVDGFWQRYFQLHRAD